MFLLPIFIAMLRFCTILGVMEAQPLSLYCGRSRAYTGSTYKQCKERTCTGDLNPWPSLCRHITHYTLNTTEYSREVWVGGDTSRSSVPLAHSGICDVAEEIDVSSLCVALPCPRVPVSPHWANPHRPNPTAGQACIQSVLLGAICHLPSWAMPALWGLRGPLWRPVRIKPEMYASSKWLRAGSPVTMTCCWMMNKQLLSLWDFWEAAHGRRRTERGEIFFFQACKHALIF